MAAPTHEPTNLATDPVCAVIVTFHPDADVIANLQALRPQVSRVVVVDNGSTPEELAQLRQAALALDVELIENGDNLGIAAALNRGIRRALELDYLWVLLFDQDSRVTEDFTQTMMGAFAASPSRDRLAILIPRYEDRR
ncbi:MAG: glycosyltransferase, partial [Acidobacteriota bacterium]